MPPVRLAPAPNRSRFLRAPIAFALATLMLLHAAAPAGARSNRERVDIATKIVRVGDAERVKVEFPAGQFEVVGTDEGDVRFEVWAECDGGRRDCAERAERIEVRGSHDGDVIDFEIDNFPKVNSRFHLEAVLYVPEGLDIDVDMGAGELTVDRVGRDLDVELGAGEVEVKMDASRVHSVDVQVGIGDAELRRPGRDHNGRGWLGKTIHWNDGLGSARVQVDLGVGEAKVRLD